MIFMWFSEEEKEEEAEDEKIRTQSIATHFENYRKLKKIVEIIYVYVFSLSSSSLEYIFDFMAKIDWIGVWGSATYLTIDSIHVK